MTEEQINPSRTSPEFEEFTAGSLDNPFLSSSFKVWIVGIIFLLTFLHLFSTILFPEFKVISKEFILGVVLALLGYIWTQEVRDRYRLLHMNEALIYAHERLKMAEVDTIETLVKMEEAKDPYVHGHSSRVAEISMAIARAMDFSPDTIETIRRAGMLHDIGKLVISDEILNKPSSLDPQEWEIVKQHPKIAVEILESLKFLYLEKKIILHHHEKIDGSGYPSGLRDREIPLESRIISVAEAFDAMNSERPYRQRCSREEIIQEMKNASGTQLDASIVASFLKVLSKNPQFWEKGDPSKGPTL